MRPAVGFVGIGRMGRPMVLRLLQAGYQVLAYDNHAVLREVVNAGARIAHSPAQVADTASVVCLCLPDAEAVMDVIGSSDGLSAGKQCSLVVDLSTIGPLGACRAGSALAAYGIEYIDAPVSGGVHQASEGLLEIMVACRSNLFGGIKEILGFFGKPFHVGESYGQAQAVACSNQLLGMGFHAIGRSEFVTAFSKGCDNR